MDLLYACWKLRDAVNDYAAMLREGNDEEAAKELRFVRKLVSRFGDEVRTRRMDSAFFAGELDEKSGERNIRYPWEELAPARTKE